MSNKQSKFRHDGTPEQPGYYAASNPCGTVKRCNKPTLKEKLYARALSGWRSSKPQPQDELE